MNVGLHQNRVSSTPVLNIAIFSSIDWIRSSHSKPNIICLQEETFTASLSFQNQGRKWVHRHLYAFLKGAISLKQMQTLPFYNPNLVKHTCFMAWFYSSPHPSNCNEACLENYSASDCQPVRLKINPQNSGKTSELLYCRLDFFSYFQAIRAQTNAFQTLLLGYFSIKCLPLYAQARYSSSTVCAVYSH